MLLLGGERLAHGLGAPSDGVLVIERLGVGSDGAEALEQLRRRIEVGEALREIDGTVLIGDARHAADDRIGKCRRTVGEFFHACPFEHLQWGKFTPMKPVGIARNALEKTLFKILENWGLHRVAFLAIIVEREAHRTRWV